MLLSPSKVPQIISQFIESEVIPKGSITQKAMAYGAIFIANEKWNSLMCNESMTSYLKLAGIMTKDNLIDLDYLHNMSSFIINKINTLPMFGYIIDENDIEKIYTIAKSMT